MFFCPGSHKESTTKRRYLIIKGKQCCAVLITSPIQLQPWHHALVSATPATASAGARAYVSSDPSTPKYKFYLATVDG